MNISKYREKNLVHYRGLFLSFCSSYVLGDIVGVSSGKDWDFWIFLSIFLLLISMKKWRILAVTGIVAYMLGWGYGYSTYEQTLEKIIFLEKEIHLFDDKKSIIGTVDSKMFSAERSNTYRLIIDNIDNRSTQENPKGMRDLSIFIEIPSNLDIQEGERISFTGKIKENVEFPLVGYARYAFYQGGYGHIFLPVFSHIDEKKSGTIFTKMREYWTTQFRKNFPQDISGILIGMTIGADEYLEKGVKDSFTKSGISHILIVSGSNIAFLIMFVLFFLKYIHIQKWGRIILIGGIVLFYGSIVGWDVSVVRASIMGVLSYFIAEYGGKASSIATLAFAGLLLTIYSPLSPVYDAGFGLSFGATIGILIFHNPLKSLWEKTRFPQSIFPFVSVSIGASLGSLPILIYHFGTIPVGSIVINILIAAVLGWILFTSILFVPIVYISPLLAYYFGYIIYIPAKYIIFLSDIFQYSHTITIGENWRVIITLLLIGGYTVFFLEKDVLFREASRKLDSE
ncbi:MAG: ComEC/Rec2 family competence protein [Candidatus Gracilibacteria bacterium]|nr:ComEC/Rec2 family competence protein [Candidatus Gracilibacteria bacterium]